MSKRDPHTRVEQNCEYYYFLRYGLHVVSLRVLQMLVLEMPPRQAQTRQRGVYQALRGLQPPRQPLSYQRSGQGWRSHLDLVEERQECLQRPHRE